MPRDLWHGRTTKVRRIFIEDSARGPCGMSAGSYGFNSKKNLSSQSHKDHHHQHRLTRC